MYQYLLTYIEGNEKLEIGKLQDDQMYRDPVAIAPTGYLGIAVTRYA